MPKYELSGRAMDKADAAGAFGAYFRQLMNMSAGLEMLRTSAANDDTLKAIDDIGLSVSAARSRCLDLFKDLAPQYMKDEEEEATKS